MGELAQLAATAWKQAADGKLSAYELTPARRFGSVRACTAWLRREAVSAEVQG
jgi:hypothetical protein